MKRFWIVLLVLAVAIALALPAGAVKPDCSTYPEGHPLVCPDDPTDPPPDDEPLAGLTCEEADSPPPAAGRNSFLCDNCGTFDVTLPPKWDTCIDVESAVAGVWEVTVTEWGDAYEIALGVQDSVAPGDACWGGCAGEVIITPEDGMPFSTPFTPASVIDACDTSFGDGATSLTFHVEARFRPPLKGDLPAVITVTLPAEESQP